MHVCERARPSVHVSLCKHHYATVLVRVCVTV